MKAKARKDMTMRQLMDAGWIGAPRCSEFYGKIACKNCGRTFDEHENCTGQRLCGSKHGWWRAYELVRRNPRNA